MGFLRDLVVRIRGDNTQLNSTLRGSESSIQSFSSKAVKGIGAAFSVAAIAAFAKQVINASEALSDKFEAAVAGAKGALTEFFRMTANADFANFFKNLSEGFDKAKNLAEALDALRDKNAYVEYVTSGKKEEASIQEQMVKDKTGKYSLERRKQAANDLKAIEQEILDLTKKALTDTYNLEAQGWENRNKMTVKKGKEVYETVVSMSQNTQDRLAQLFEEADKLYGSGKDIFGSKKKYISQKAGAISDETIQAYRDYLTLMKNGEEDVIPKLFKIFQNLSEGKTAAQERFNGVLRITNTLLEEQNGIIRKTPIPTSPTGQLTAGSFSSFAPDKLSGKPVTSGVQMSEEQSAWIESWRRATEEVTSMISDAFIGLWESIGSGSFDGFGDQLLSSFGRFIANFGKMLVAMGSSMLLALTLMKAPSIPTAIAAIAAGGVAMAIGGLMMGMANKQANNMSAGYGSSGSSSMQNIKVQVEGKISGKDIYISNRRYIEDNG